MLTMQLSSAHLATQVLSVLAPRSASLRHVTLATTAKRAPWPSRPVRLENTERINQAQHSMTALLAMRVNTAPTMLLQLSLELVLLDSTALLMLEFKNQ